MKTPRILAFLLLSVLSFAQVNVAPLVPPIVLGPDFAGAKIYAYISGTTTPLATYQDSAGTILNSNPVILDANGIGRVFVKAQSYKIVLKSALDVTILTLDNLTTLAVLGKPFLSDTLANRPTSCTATVQFFVQTDSPYTLWQCNSTGTGWNVLVPTWIPSSIGTAGQRPTVNSAGTAAPFVTPIEVEARAFPGTTCGDKIQAADTSLGAVNGTIIVNSECGNSLGATPVVISSGHHLRLLSGSGTFTSTLNSALYGPIRLKSNSSLTCDDWSTMIQESSTPGTRQSIVQAFQSNLANVFDSNILVSGCHFQGANPAHTGAPATIELSNCHNCRATGNWLDQVTGNGFLGGGPSGSTYGDGIWLTDNLITGGGAQMFAIVNAQNWHIDRNIAREPGTLVGGSAVGSMIDIEPNGTADLWGPGTIIGNLFDYRAAVAVYGYPVTVTGNSNGTSIHIADNIFIGGLLPTETGGPTRNIPSCISVGDNSPYFAYGINVTGNTCTMVTQAAYAFRRVSNSTIANNVAVCPGGSNGYIRMEDGSQSNNVNNNSFTDPCGSATSPAENIEEDGASISNNRIWGNLATAATLVGAGSVEASRIDPTTGVLIAAVLNASTLNGATFAAPGAIGGGTPSSVAATLLKAPNTLISATAPTVSSGFGSSPSVTVNNGTAAFVIDVGTGGTASAGVIGLPTATAGWNCTPNNITATAANRADQRTVQTASSTATATIQNQTISTGAALAWTASDLIRVSCFAY